MAHQANTALTELRASVEARNVERVSELLKNGVKPDRLLEDAAGQKTNALCTAARNADLAIVKLLLEYWTNKRTKRSQSNRAVQIASEACHQAYQKANSTKFPYLANTTAKEQAEASAKTESLERVVELLLESGADVPMPCFMSALSIGHTKLAALFMNAGIDVSYKAMLGTPLKVAASRGLTDMVRELLVQGADPNSKDFGGTPLMHALAEGHIETAQLLVDQGADVNLTDTASAPALVTAASKGNLEVAAFLIEHDADLNAKGNVVCGDLGDFSQSVVEAFSGKSRTITMESPPIAEAATALHVAVRMGRVDFASLLIDAGADVNATDVEGKTPLHWAKLVGNAEIQDRLKNAGAIESSFEAGSPEAALIAAAAAGDLKQVQRLIASGISLDLKHGPNQGPRQTPLIAAAAAGQKEVVSWLLDQGASIDLRTGPSGELHQPTPLLAAAAAGQHEVVKTLIESGANPNDRDRHCGERENGVLHLASRQGHSRTVSVLVEAGAKLEALAAEPQTPLACACENGHTETAKLLLSLGANVNPRKAGICPPLTAAIKAGDYELVDFLLDEGASAAPDGANSYHQPIWVALSAENRQLAERLLESATIETADRPTTSRGLSTCLADIAIDEGKHDFVNKLLTAGADANCTSIDFTPLMGAVRSRSPAMAKLLTDAGADPLVRTKGYECPLVLAYEQLERVRDGWRPSEKKAAEELLAVLVSAGGEAASDRIAELGSAEFAFEVDKVAETQELPDFQDAAETAEYAEAVELAAKLLNAAPKPLADPTIDHLYGCKRFVVLARSAEQLVLEHRETLLERNCYLFSGVSTCLDEYGWLGLLPTNRYQDVLLALQTNGANCELGPEDVIERLESLEEEYPFALTGAGFDWCSGKFNNKVVAPTRLAKAFYEFCPDIVDQGCGTVTALADELKKSQTFFFWWD